MHFYFTKIIERFNLADNCPERVGGNAGALSKRNGPILSRLFLNATISCNTTLTGWMYHRSLRTARAFAVIWRNGTYFSNKIYTVVHVTELPATTVGIKRILLDHPVTVRINDIIGITYDSNTQLGQTSYCTANDEGCSDGPMYTTFTASVFANNIYPGYNLFENSMSYAGVEAYSLQALLNGNTPGKL